MKQKDTGRRSERRSEGGVKEVKGEKERKNTGQRSNLPEDI